MTAPSPRAEVEIRGTRVGFLRRDIRQISDAERTQVEHLVAAVQAESDPDQIVARIVIETDYPDPDRLSYRASYRVYATERIDNAGAGESVDRRDQG